MSFLRSKIRELENGREVLEMPDSVNFAIVTKDKFLLLARQFRVSNRKETLNLFGGYIVKIPLFQMKKRDLWRGKAGCRFLIE